ncbi:MAG TPA: malectin domain-containing carbohydrate-binding protein, partial [Humisphaera sp.]
MGQKTKTAAAVRPVAAPAATDALRRAVVETVEARTLMCSIPHGPQTQGTAVPWLSAPLMASAVTVPESTDTPAAAAPVVGEAARVLAPVGTAALRINAGGPAYTDSQGRAWKADDGFVGGTGTSSSVAIANTVDDALYAARRYGAFNYNIPVSAPGTYTVKLHFADPLYTTPGKRKFAVKLEGATVLNYFDVAAAGGGKAALVKTLTANVTDGTLNLAFLKQVENPIVSAIEVIPPSGAVGTVSSLSLIDARTDAVLGAFAGGATLDVGGGNQYSVRADVSGAVKSVRFLLDGQPIRVESTAPYAVAGDSGTGDYAPWTVAAGQHTLTAVPYSGTGATGTAGAPVSVTFTVTGTPPQTGDTFTAINWATKASSPIVRAEALKATHDGKLYVFGGFSGTLGPVVRSDVYDPAANTWSRIRDLPQRLTHVGVTQTDTDVYFVGGYVGLAGQTGYGQTYGSNKVWRYNFATDTYTAMPNLPKALAGGGAVVIDNKLYYFGGQDSTRGDINIHLVLDLANPAGGWKALANIPHGRSHMGAVAFGGKIYTIAGQIGNDAGLTTLNYVEVYDPATNAWSTRTAIPRAMSHIYSGTFVMGDRIIVMGGESAHGAQIRDAWAYTPATNTWVALTSLPAARFSGV